MRAPAPRNARACTAPDARQPRCSVLTTHPTPAFVLSQANLGAQGGLDFLSVAQGGLDFLSVSGLIEPGDVREMLAWENSGFSLDASVRVGAHDRAGLERLLRYCARPPFALERLELLEDERVVYRLPKPHRDGTTALTLTPLELIAIRAGLNFVPYHRLIGPPSTTPQAGRGPG